jgi:hypothetical protein
MARWTLVVVAVVVLGAVALAVVATGPDSKGTESATTAPASFTFFDHATISQRTISPSVDAERYNHITFTAEIRGLPRFLQIQLSNDGAHWIPLAVASGDCDQSHNPLTFGGGSCLVSARYYRLVAEPRPARRLTVTVLSHLGT